MGSFVGNMNLKIIACVVQLIPNYKGTVLSIENILVHSAFTIVMRSPFNLYVKINFGQRLITEKKKT